MKFISEALANWQLERLESLIAHARSRAKMDRLRSGSLVCEHLNLADEHLDEAIAAMKYNRYDQASYACQSGFMQLGLAELLLQYGSKLDAGMQKVLLLAEQKEHLPEEEELTAYLASTLAEMKMAIEYSNCQVSARAHAVLDRAMDYYNDSLNSIKQSEAEQTKQCAQAGLLSMLLASELISAENQIALPGWRGLSNPMLAGPLRRASQLVTELAETRQKLHKKEKQTPEALDQEEIDKNAILRKHWEKAYNDFLLAIHSLAAGSVSHAQALLKASLREMEVVRDIIGMEDPERLEEELERESTERTPVADALSALAEIKNIIAETKLQRKDYVLSSLDKVAKLYTEGMKYYEKGNYARAEKSVGDALLELDLLRQQVQLRKLKV